MSPFETIGGVAAVEYQSNSFTNSIVTDNISYLLTFMRVFGLGFVTGNLPQYFTKPDIWHLGLNLDVSHSF